MTEKELGQALLKLDATQLSGTPDARQLTWKILERDRLRVQLLSSLTVAVWVFAAIIMLMEATLAAIAVLTLAALCTVFLLFASRRATLRQFNASLMEISEQLKELRQARGK